ncbi:MAG TPA: hypothetical protein VG889_11960 [Rhizomicrobium sp.]|nr:hypothetical protein [Rhizomicrobium sp.]
MELNAADFCRLAADLTAEYGVAARDHARCVIGLLEREGDAERAGFWCVLSVFIDDVALKRLDPEGSIVLH